MRNKRGQEVIGMSYGFIFAIILIIALVALAFYVIWIFIAQIQPCTQQGMFKQDLQSNIDRAYRGMESNFTFSYALGGAIKEVCFVDTTSGVGGKGSISIKEKYTKLMRYFYQKRNMFFYPPADACDNSPGYELKNVDIAKMTLTENPYCVQIKSGKINLVIQKGTGDSLIITR